MDAVEVEIGGRRIELSSAAHALNFHHMRPVARVRKRVPQPQYQLVARVQPKRRRGDGIVIKVAIASNAVPVDTGMKGQIRAKRAVHGRNRVGLFN